MNAIMVRRPAPRMLAMSVAAEKKAELQPSYRIGSSSFMVLVDVGLMLPEQGFLY